MRMCMCMWHVKKKALHLVIHLCVMCGALSRPQFHPTTSVCERDPRGVGRPTFFAKKYYWGI